MGRVLSGRVVGAKLVEALGLPVQGCMSAEVVLPDEDVAQVVLRYQLTPEALDRLAKALCGDDLAGAADRVPGSNGPVPGARPAPPPNPPRAR